MKSTTNTKTKRSVLYKSIFKHIILIAVFIISSILMSGSGEFSDIAFCIWCLTLVQMSEL
jgi:membrane protein involved in colicin uptake